MELPITTAQMMQSRARPSVRTHLINRERVRCWRFGAAARREEEEYPSWIFDRPATPLQPQGPGTLRAKLWRAAGGVAPQSQSALAMLPRRALPAAHQSLAHSFPIYEIGSSEICAPNLLTSCTSKWKASTRKSQISRSTVQVISKFESSKTDRVMLSCFEFWAVKFGLGFGNSDLEL